ncbi:MAG: response regulator receiver modulated CheB methylesterase, partial [Cyanobacteria bacterium RYN_339]|nr:response regulator receiver modulated CheB methylesterase [Cyanobacteria bacterium RYN_339]
MAKIRLLVAEDSLTVRKHLVEVASSDPDIEVVGEARNGREAVELCQRLRPDVITLDMVMPGMTGLEATEEIMGYCPTPILIVSASFNRGELHKTYEALAAGAVDVLDKPRGDSTDERWARTFLSTVKLVSRIKVITHPRAKLAAARRPVPPPAPDPQAGRYDLVVIGAS